MKLRTNAKGTGETVEVSWPYVVTLGVLWAEAGWPVALGTLIAGVWVAILVWMLSGSKTK